MLILTRLAGNSQSLLYKIVNKQDKNKLFYY